jgi:hypothetical protein
MAGNYEKLCNILEGKYYVICIQTILNFTPIHPTTKMPSRKMGSKSSKSRALALVNTKHSLPGFGLPLNFDPIDYESSTELTDATGEGPGQIELFPSALDEDSK